jgi:Ca2+-binding EF-hand superfamily protein
MAIDPAEVKPGRKFRSIHCAARPNDRHAAQMTNGRIFVTKRYAAAAAVLGMAAIALPSAAAAQAAKGPTRAGLVKMLEGRFSQIDGNKDGTLTRAEVESAHSDLMKAANSEMGKAIDGQFAEMDSNKDGKVSNAEAIAIAPAERKAAVGTAFAKFDTNKDGNVTLAEFRAAAPKPRLGTTDDFLKKFDGNKDGKVTLDEYKTPGLAQFDKIDANKDGVVSEAEQGGPGR